LTPAFFDELLKIVSTSRRIPPTPSKIKRRLPGSYNIAIVSTGLSYLAYLGALEKVQRGYKPTRLGKKIGKFLARDSLEEANVAWAELLKRHKLYSLFKKYFRRKGNERGTIEDFGVFLKKKAHAKWDVYSARSRISRLCELFADKGIIEYQNGDLLPIENGSAQIADEELLPAPKNLLTIEESAKKTAKILPQNISLSGNSWPIRLEIKLEISEKVNSQTLEAILSFIKELRKTWRVNENESS